MSPPRPPAGRNFGTFMIKSWRVISHPRVLIKLVVNKGARPPITLSDYTRIAPRVRRPADSSRVTIAHNAPAPTGTHQKVRKIYSGRATPACKIVSRRRTPPIAILKFDRFVTVCVPRIPSGDRANAFA